MLRNDQPRTVQPLEAVNEHRPVGFREHIRTDLDHEIGAHADQILVERRMMQLAWRETIGDLRLACGVRILGDVSRVEARSTRVRNSCW